MTRWHTSTELHTTVAVGVKTLYLAGAALSRLDAGYALGLDLDTAARVEPEAGKSDTSG